ncbi:Cupredoxin [Calycina marina]|uniref:Cupredoxin n=1 Tax=Calycina marina TaxID=1763456 RepID=A0A9P8CCT2_9HELO|nr:Cupredoxin [Calycina marina]
MRYSTVLAAFTPVVLAQYGSDSSSSSSSSASTTSSTPSSTASATKGIQTVLVGSTALSFTPNNITADIGTVVEFVFYPKTHSVAQASFADPCMPLANATGFFSGPQTIASGMGDNVFAITINDTKPIWFYCAYPNHCQGGMVGVINAPADGSKTVDMFAAAAANVSTTVSPSYVQGGTLEDASAVTVPSASATGAGIETKGSINLGLALTGLLAAAFAGLIV